ncbi:MULTISPECIES: hypothetical protein [Halorubrum]|uniref:hypothetical protein n=1 Tax=Halorubrum TaxID=56688 RepID=UPI0009B59C15|nr:MULTISPECIES: hypothetical protein [Halorubrum]
MTSSGTFRLGRLKTENEELPSPSELGDSIGDDFTTRSEEEDPVTGEPIEFAEKGRNVFVGEEYAEYNFCFFTYVADTNESFRVREEGEEKENNQVVLETAWVIYFDNGQFAFQSRDDIADAWIPRFIKKRSGIQITDDDFTLDRLGQGELKHWYDQADRVSKIKLSQDADSTSSLSDSAGEIRQLAEIAEGLSFSTGRGNDGDLREANLIEDATEALEIKKINVKKGDQNMITVKQSGRVNISWNESDWDQESLPRNRGQTIRSKLRPYLQSIRDSN